MAVLITIEFEVTPDQYDQVAAKISADPPDGAIVRSAVDKGGTMKIVDIYESAEKFGAFAQDRLGAMVADVLGQEVPLPEPQIEELHDYWVSAGSA